LTGPAGRMTTSVIAAVAQFERDLLIERTISGQARAKAAGVKFGRPNALKNGERAAVLAQLATGISISQAARDAGVSRATVMRAAKADTRNSA
jgi:putative DNA-invertase from lambdoid prophage Rac